MDTITVLDVLMLGVQILLAIVAFFGALVGNNLIAAIKELRATDTILRDKFDSYAKGTDIQEIKVQIGGIFKRLEEIKDAVGDKVSREELLLHLTNQNQTHHR